MSPSLEESVDPRFQGEEADFAMIKSARVWFNKALGIDPGEEVAADFIRMVSDPVVFAVLLEMMESCADRQIDHPESRRTPPREQMMLDDEDEKEDKSDSWSQFSG